MTRICITGAAGNLGRLTAEYLLDHSDCDLSLMIHRKPTSTKLSNNSRVRIFRCDLATGQGVDECLRGVDVVIHYASVLFKAHPERFMPTTNTKYFERVVTAAKSAGVKRIILSSFPQVEGSSSPALPSTDRLGGKPESVHARTRLAEERFLRSVYPDGIVLRIGMVYGRGILMPDAARWFAQRRLLGVWKSPTGIHLISTHDYLACVHSAALKEWIRGTYNLGDEGIQTLQDYLDFACQQWRCSRPWRMPERIIYGAAKVFETISIIFGVQSPLTRDFLDIGRVSYYGDTTRMRSELLPTLKYRTMREGAETF